MSKKQFSSVTQRVDKVGVIFPPLFFSSPSTSTEIRDTKSQLLICCNGDRRGIPRRTGSWVQGHKLTRGFAQPAPFGQDQKAGTATRCWSRASPSRASEVALCPHPSSGTKCWRTRSHPESPCSAVPRSLQPAQRGQEASAVL